MTGIDSTPATLPAGPRPEGPRRRYSLSRLFLNVYLVAMGSFVAIAFFADFVISSALQGITDDYAQRFMRGTVVLIEEDLYRTPRSEWPLAIRKLDDKFAYKLDLVDRRQVDLTPRQDAKLDAGEIAVDDDGDRMYHRIKGTSQVLILGPLSPDHNPEYQRTIPLELRIRLLTWSLTGLCFGLALWLWIRPIWRDLEALRITARALGEGRFSARTPPARSRLFELLAETLNRMAERIQLLIATQKEISSAISHELRTPIARLRFALEMFNDTDEAAERERLSKMMEADLVELDNLIDSSLTYARFEQKKPELCLSSVELKPWVDEQVAAMRILGRGLDLRVELDNLPEGFSVDLDRKQMPYAIGNLLRNAVKYTKSQIVVHGEVVGAQQDRLALHVDDDGIGVPPEDRDHVFTAFTRLDRSRDRATGGYGLGLAIARLILEQHGGNASVGVSPLGGARFTLTWPLHG